MISTTSLFSLSLFFRSLEASLANFRSDKTCTLMKAFLQMYISVCVHPMLKSLMEIFSLKFKILGRLSGDVITWFLCFQCHLPSLLQHTRICV